MHDKFAAYPASDSAMGRLGRPPKTSNPSKDSTTRSDHSDAKKGKVSKAIDGASLNLG